MSSKTLFLFNPRLWGQDNQQTSWSVNAKTATGLVLCIALLSLVGWLYLTQASQIAAVETRMQGTVKEIEKLERENALLRYQVAQLETIPRIEARAKQLGLGPMHKETTYLTVPKDLWALEMGSLDPPVAAMSMPTRSVVIEPTPEFSLPSLLELWDEVKVQVQTWAGQ